MCWIDVPFYVSAWLIWPIFLHHPIDKRVFPLLLDMFTITASSPSSADPSTSSVDQWTEPHILYAGLFLLDRPPYVVSSALLLRHHQPLSSPASLTIAIAIADGPLQLLSLMACSSGAMAA
jgi:hypothetical protein